MLDSNDAIVTGGGILASDSKAGKYYLDNALAKPLNTQSKKQN